MQLLVITDNTSELYLSLRVHHPAATYFATSCYESVHQGCHVLAFTLHCFVNGARLEANSKLVSVLLHPHDGVIEGTITEGPSHRFIGRTSFQLMDGSMWKGRPPCILSGPTTRDYCFHLAAATRIDRKLYTLFLCFHL